MTQEQIDRPSLEMHDTLTLAIEQLGYFEALFAALADTLEQIHPQVEKVARARQLALLGRGHAEQWGAIFLGDGTAGR